MSVIRCLVDAACEIMELAADDGRLLLENVSNEKGRRRREEEEGGRRRELTSRIPSTEEVAVRVVRKQCRNECNHTA